MLLILSTTCIGEFGIVYKARMSKGFNKSFTEVVAVKTLKGSYRGERGENIFYPKLPHRDLLYDPDEYCTFQDFWSRV